MQVTASDSLQATKRFTEHLPPPWRLESRPRCGPAHAAKNAFKWNRGDLKAAERFVVRWHEDEAKLDRKRHADVTCVAPKGMRMEGETVAGKSRLVKGGTIVNRTKYC